MQGHWLPRLVGGIALLLALALRVADPTIIQQARLAVFDTYQRIEPRAYQPVPVRVLDIDDESLARFGQWPWPRDLLADLVVRLTQLGASAIAFDMLFAEPDRTSPAQLASLLPADDATAPLRAQLTALPDHDALLAEMVAQSPVVLGFTLLTRPTGARPALKTGFANAGADPVAFLPNYAGAIANLPVLEVAARGNGSFSIGEEGGATGIVRQIPLLQALDGQLYPTLSVEALRVAQGASTIVVRASDASGNVSFGEATGLTHLKIGAVEVPVTRNGQLWLHYTDWVPERMLPAWRVLELTGSSPDLAAVQQLVAGNIVLVGTSASGLLDLRSTPLRPFEPGVAIHAQALEQMILGTFLQRPDWASGAELFALLVVGMVLVGLLPRVGPLWAAGLGLGVIAAGVAASWLSFERAHMLFDPLYPTLGSLIVYFAMTALLFFRTEQQRRYVRQAFSRYLAPALVDRLADHPEQLVLGGETRELTLMFSDIRGFTTISETMDPQALTRFINDFLTPMSEIILVQGGTIDKYIGDCIMAFWNAPLPVPDHAVKGCRAALDMRARLVDLNDRWRQEAEAAGRPFTDIAIGIGLNTGQCCVGNMGSQQRLEYSVLGDTVNLASRLEGQTKLYGVDIVIGETTREQAPGFAALELDLIRVKGKQQPARIFTLLGDDAVAREPGFAALQEVHDRLLGAYRARLWDEAEAALADCRARGGPGLKLLYDLYAERIEQYREEAPVPDWDAVFTARTK